MGSELFSNIVLNSFLKFYVQYSAMINKCPGIGSIQVMIDFYKGTGLFDKL